MLDLADRVVQRIRQRRHVGVQRLATLHHIRYFRIGQRAFGDDALQRRAAQLQVALAQVDAVEQRAAGLAARLGAGRQLLEFLVERVVARGDGSHGAASAPGSNPTSNASDLDPSWPARARRTGANERRCTGQAPCSASLSMCSRVP